MPKESNEAEQDVKTVADQIAETLAIAGVKRIYGIVGDSLNGLTDAGPARTVKTTAGAVETGAPLRH